MRKLEVIAATLEDAINAESGGADSLELVENLPLGGLTPPIDTVNAIRDKVSIFIRVIVRPYADSFVYSAADAALMLRDIEALKQIGVDGIVFGALNSDHTVNLDLTRQISQAAHPLELTFHRAIDVSSDYATAIPDLKGTVQRILTSGLKDNVWDGRATLKAWIAQYGQDFTIACGGGIRMENLSDIVQATDGSEYHVGTAAQTNGIVDSTKVRQMLDMINAA